MSASATISKSQFEVNQHDIEIMRPLAQKVLDIANSPLMAEKIRDWKTFNRNQANRPMVLCEHDGGIKLVDPDFRHECQASWLHRYEAHLKMCILHFEVLKDDLPITPWLNVPWFFSDSGYGVEIIQHRGVDAKGGKTGFAWESPIKDLETDLHLLKDRTWAVDREGSMQMKAALQEVVGDILPVRIRGGMPWSYGMTWAAIDLIGLGQLLTAFYDTPDELHQLMDYLRRDRHSYLNWAEAEGLLSLNNENDYIGSGSYGMSDELPGVGFQEGEAVMSQHIWALVESQETVGVSPTHFGEFIFPYQLDLAKRFGAVYYGCCEPVHDRWSFLEQIPNLKRVSCSPWVDQEAIAEAMGGRVGFSRKQAPSMISTNSFDEQAIAKDLKNTVDICGRHGVRNLELVMKDVHTLNDEPYRLKRWVELARESLKDWSPV